MKIESIVMWSATSKADAFFGRPLFSITSLDNEARAPAHLVPLAAHLIAEQECQQSNWEKRDCQHQGSRQSQKSSVSDEKRPRSGQNCSVSGKKFCETLTVLI